jgi:hypothetical protein
MANILDSLDVIKNIENMYESNTAFGVLKDFERVLDELDLYVYANWEDGELAEGPNVDRHWVSAKFFWPRDKMPDPMGGKRLLDYDCHVNYQKSYIVKPKKIRSPDDFRPGTKKGKLEREPIWIVEIRMPKNLLSEIYNANLDDLDIQEVEKDTAPTPDMGAGMENPLGGAEQSAPAGGGEPGATI